MGSNPRSAAARAFVRSLNILLKFVRMYDFGHPRTTAQYEIAWSELRAALGPDDETGLLLSASGEQLLLDGIALESAAAEKSFAKLLSTAGIASIHFAPNVTQSSLARLVKAFPTGGSKPDVLAQQLKDALQGDSTIHINEICFVPADSAVVRGSAAATIAAHAFGGDAEKFNQLFNDPQKLLQLITAADGLRSERMGLDDTGDGNPGATGGRRGQSSGGSGTSDSGSSGGGGLNPGMPNFGLSWFESGDEGVHEEASAGAQVITGGRASEHAGGSGGSGSGSAGSGRGGRGFAGSGGGGGRTDHSEGVVLEAGLIALHQDELQGILKMLRHVARLGNDGDPDTASMAFQSRVASLPQRARFTLTQALAGIAAKAPANAPDQSTLLRLAEHVAIRFALESYQRGDVKVDAVREMLDAMGAEIESLRKILSGHEEKLARAGISVKGHTEVLAQQFWNELPAEKRNEALLSPNAWCIPASSVRQSVEALQKSGDAAAAAKILENYVNCIRNPNAETRRAVAHGVAELAPFYGSFEDKLFVSTIRELGLTLNEESDSESRSVISAAFVRLAQEAGQRRSYTGMQRAIEMVDYIESERPAVAKNLRPRLAVESRLAEFVDDAVKADKLPVGLVAFLRRIPGPAAETLAQRFSRTGFRQDADLLLEAMSALGPDAVTHLRQTLLNAPAQQAVDVIAMLSRLDLAALEAHLPGRMTEWKRSSHDRVVRQLAASGAPERGHLILGIFDSLDPLVQPLALDEIGLAGEQDANHRLIRIAEGDLPPGATAFLQLKAIEALGRLRTSGSEKVLRRIVEGKQVWRWTFPSELRIVAAQALEKIDPDWAKHFLPKSGLSVAELAIQPLDIETNSTVMRQRRYARLHLERPMSGETMNLKENCEIEIPEMNLGGGVAVSDQALHPGTIVSLRMSADSKPVRAQAIVRDANMHARAFEVIDIDLEERARLRKLLVQIGSVLKAASSDNRGRNRGRTILTPSSQ
jgi:hypothetical protein